ncbi:MAG: T9SS type A sorting domain-containing protein [Chitinophagaceae bacterium]|nr:T9SS type A sorting domain-containing protein [Chitinophagaceae bacterium]
MKKLLFSFSLIVSTIGFSQTVPADSTPVRVKSFEASQSVNATKLNWSVVCFLQYAKFVVERSNDGINYTIINTFQADRLRCRQPFDFEDKSSSGKVFYRLKVGDLDGNFATSKVVAVFGKSKGFDITAMAPTVVTSTAQLSISSASADKVMIYITSMQGVAILNKSFTVLKGNNTISLNLSSLPKGTFVLSSYNSEGQLKTKRFIKQ